jgi:hypothetical protein
VGLIGEKTRGRKSRDTVPLTNLGKPILIRNTDFLWRFLEKQKKITQVLLCNVFKPLRIKEEIFDFLNTLKFIGTVEPFFSLESLKMPR